MAIGKVWAVCSLKGMENRVCSIEWIALGEAEDVDSVIADPRRQTGG